jgi:integrase
VKPLRAKNAGSRLKGHVYPIIGETRVRDVTLADVERVMASLTGKRPTQRKLSALTRRTIALTLNRLFSIAVYPLKIIASHPIPKGLVPKAGKRRAMAYLYPDEDAKLMAHAPIPLAERAFWGFLCREGCRVSEALAMRWTDLDLERGIVRLDKNKTDDPRAWALSPGVAAALKSLRPKPAEGLVFPQPADPLSLATDLRARLVEAGVKRPELHTATAERMALRAHDLRGSFVTVAFANGRSESWVADRTGHRSSQMLARYKRQARLAEETKLGDWTPLDVALGLAKRSTPPGAPKRGTPSRARRGARTRVGQRVGQNSAPDTIRTYDLGFRKGSRTRGVVFPYKSRTIRLSVDRLRLRGVVSACRFHAIAIDARDRASKVVRVEVRVALRGREVGVTGELLDRDRRRAVPEELRHEEVPQVVKAPTLAPSARLGAFERLVEA